MVTAKQAEVAIQEMLAMRQPPDGYRIYRDRKTFNVIVSGPTLAFCATERAIEEGYFRDQYIPCLERLIECEAGAAKPADLWFTIEPAK